MHAILRLFMPAALGLSSLAHSAAGQVEDHAIYGGNGYAEAAMSSCEAAWLPAFGGASGVSGPIYALTVFDDGDGEALYAGGSFTSAGGVAANNIAKWDGTSWSALESGVSFGGSGTVHALAVFDDGSGPALYAGGSFTVAGGVAAQGIAKWNGTSWSALGAGLDRGAFPAEVYAMTVFDDGGGPALYAGGTFPTAGGITVNSIAKWNGTIWSKLGSGMGHAVWAFPFPVVYALTVFDDGTGEQLYAGGDFNYAGDISAYYIAKWDGTTWSKVASGSDYGMTHVVRALTVFDDGAGPALFAGGYFWFWFGFDFTLGIAKWDGTSWSEVGGGMGAKPGSPVVQALAVLDDGSGAGSELYAGGTFTSAGGVLAQKIAKWNGTSWSALGSGMNDDVASLVAFDDGGGGELYAGGPYTMSPAGDSFLAHWGCPAFTSLPGCAGNPAVLAALSPTAPLGMLLPLQVEGLAALSGFGLVYAGSAGVDVSGCGFLVPGLGELLLALAPSPLFVAGEVLAGGISALYPFVPSNPALAGVTVALQGLAVDLTLPQPIELTNALAVQLGP